MKCLQLAIRGWTGGDGNQTSGGNGYNGGGGSCNPRIDNCQGNFGGGMNGANGQGNSSTSHFGLGCNEQEWCKTMDLNTYHFKNFNLSAGFGGEGYEGMICPGCVSGGGGGGIMVDGKAPNIIGPNGCTLGCGLGYGAGGGGCSGFPQKGQPGVILIEVAN